MKILLSIILLFLFGIVNSQSIKGIVKGEVNKNESENLAGASVWWADTDIAVNTDTDGKFEIPRSSETDKLVINFIGYEKDTIIVQSNQADIQVVLKKNQELESVDVVESNGAQFHSTTSIGLCEVMTGEGLIKLPCCNLSESFENNASVDVSSTDAVSGSKQIKMLGLSGKYSQIMRENMYGVRGLTSSYGLTFIPGSWIESIQISKGAASVINGYESATGQINTELKKPQNAERLFINLFANSEYKFEANLTSAAKINDKLSTVFLLHASNLSVAADHNHDGFVDLPLMQQYNFANKWNYNGVKVKSQFGFHIIDDTKKGGQIDYINDEIPESGELYGIDIKTRKFETFGKIGFPVEFGKKASIGTQYSVSRSEIISAFGNKNYSGYQNSAYANIIYNSEILNEHSSINAGTSFMYDDYIEEYNYSDFLRTEIVPGIFAQYSYNSLKKFSATLGTRLDFNSKYGTFFTPRLHMKYNISSKLIARASAGKAYRTANIFSENQSILASSRELKIIEDLNPEIAYNYGISLNYKTTLSKKKEISATVDFYRTDFQNQIIADIDADFRSISFYNLKGKSYADNFQVEISGNPIKHFDVLAALRITNVKTTMHDELINEPFVSKYKGLLTLSYYTKYQKWSFDFTNQFVGKSYLPKGGIVFHELPEAAGTSPAYYILHAQITRKFKYISFYTGVENLTDFTQKMPVISHDNPFSETFDASMIWGPIMWRTFYAGLRFTLE